MSLARSDAIRTAIASEDMAQPEDDPPEPAAAAAASSGDSGTRRTRAAPVGSHQFQRPNSDTTAGTSSAADERRVEQDAGRQARWPAP